MYHLLRGHVAGLRHDPRGSAIAMMTAGLIPCIAALGAAIDIGRMYIVKSQLQAGVDAAALAGARSFGSTDGTAKSRTAQANAYFEGNFPRTPPYMGVSDIVVTQRYAIVDTINTTTISARVTLPMTFMRMFGIREQSLEASARAELQPRPLEVMVVLDNTGSMRDNLSAGRTRITALKESATSFVDILFQGSTQRRDLAIGFVPYDVTVNVGSLLATAQPGSIAPLDGFTSGAVLGGGSWPDNPYHWKGCVMNDRTVRDVSADRTVSEPGAWDLTRTLPGENGAPAVDPFFVPPMYVPALAANAADAAQRANPASTFYRLPGTGTEQRNNLYRLDISVAGTSRADHLANSAAYRSYLYDYYIGLNNGAAAADDDVIRLTNNGYYAPASGDRLAATWYVDWRRIPNYTATDPVTGRSYWLAPTTAAINPDGGRVQDINQDITPMPSPNWQCPEAAMPVRYDRTRAEYVSYIRDKNAALYPANGTIHHSGLLWGYRLLVRDDKFVRPRPSGVSNETARRALVFMTDGLNAVTELQNGYYNRTFTWYGRWADARNGANSIASDEAQTETQMLRRFAKTCANIQREINAPEIYIIALVANSAEVDDAFNRCAPGRVYQTSNAEELNAAFEDVASELVDLHLVQ
ncbi:MAG TPA: TadE/TadG family type IV pilus assembly protein [Sphingomonas sp.]|nr:TadE/TadG family type IV pilus assembly protein [Sphingomonas sp.]